MPKLLERHRHLFLVCNQWPIVPILSSCRLWCSFNSRCKWTTTCSRCSKCRPFSRCSNNKWDQVTCNPSLETRQLPVVWKGSRCSQTWTSSSSFSKPCFSSNNTTSCCRCQHLSRCLTRATIWGRILWTPSSFRAFLAHNLVVPLSTKQLIRNLWARISCMRLTLKDQGCKISNRISWISILTDRPPPKS